MLKDYHEHKSLSPNATKYGDSLNAELLEIFSELGPIDRSLPLPARNRKIRSRPFAQE
jgi:hypothetical protein